MSLAKLQVFASHTAVRKDDGGGGGRWIDTLRLAKTDGLRRWVKKLML
ncbi:hypothetical protein GW937_02520 [Candidatus Kaiserbacteria bacterium]|nr:hypothetical protein [Candidatus Kaiserbacteria bacterium]